DGAWPGLHRHPLRTPPGGGSGSHATTTYLSHARRRDVRIHVTSPHHMGTSKRFWAVSPESRSRWRSGTCLHSLSCLAWVWVRKLASKNTVCLPPVSPKTSTFSEKCDNPRKRKPV